MSLAKRGSLMFVFRVSHNHVPSCLNPFMYNAERNGKGLHTSQSGMTARSNFVEMILTVSETLRHGKGCNVEFDIHYSPYNFVG